ncbi:MAG: MarR family winged helix-turn-helix transcriptional regulator [Acidimicrobiales bacterium]
MSASADDGGQSGGRGDATQPPTEVLLAVSLFRASALLTGELDRELQEATGFGLSEALVIIQIKAGRGRLKMADLADSLVITRGGITKIVDRLVSGGFLDRVPSEEDRRVIYAEVTDKALELLRAQQPIVDSVTERRLAAVLTEAELRQATDVLRRVLAENPGWEPSS